MLCLKTCKFNFGQGQILTHSSQASMPKYNRNLSHNKNYECREENMFIRKSWPKRVPGNSFTFYLRSNKGLYEKFKEVLVSMRHGLRGRQTKFSSSKRSGSQISESGIPRFQKVHQGLKRGNITIQISTPQQVLGKS